MIKNLELSDPDSCLNKAKDDELLFVLLGRDASAPVAVRAWIEDRIKTGKNRKDDTQILEAETWIRSHEFGSVLQTLPSPTTVKDANYILHWIQTFLETAGFDIKLRMHEDESDIYANRGLYAEKKK